MGFPITSARHCRVHLLYMSVIYVAEQRLHTCNDSVNNYSDEPSVNISNARDNDRPATGGLHMHI